VRVFGIDPGSERTGYGCVDTDGSRHRCIACGAITVSRATAFPDRLLAIHTQLAALIAEFRPACVAIETLFFAANGYALVYLSVLIGLWGLWFVVLSRRWRDQIGRASCRERV